MSFNVFTNKKKSFAGAHHVWHEVRRTLIAGGTIDVSKYPVGSLIPAGTPIYISKAGDQVELLEFYEVTESVNTTKTKVAKGLGLPKPVVGDFIMIAPDALTGTGTGVKVTAVSENANDYEITTSATLGSVEAGTALVKVSEAGADLPYPSVPNALSWHDVYLEEGTHAATIAGVQDGTIYADRIAPLPKAIKAALPLILFQEGV